MTPPKANPDDYFAEGEVSLYRDLAELQADANVATQLLVSVFSLSEAPLIEPLRERFEAIASRIERRVSKLQDNQVRSALKPIFDWLFDLGMGEDNGFDLRAPGACYSPEPADPACVKPGHLG